MRPGHEPRINRWRIVERLLDQIAGTPIRLVLVVAPEPLDVVLYETAVLARGEPSSNPLRGFIQEAISLLEQPTAAEVAALLRLPTAVVELVLGNLQQMGGVVSDAAGRWSVPDGAPRFRADMSDTPIWRRVRRLLCYWPKHQVLLPVLPRLRRRDLVKLQVHTLRGDLAQWYDQMASWSQSEGRKRGLPESVRLLPLSSTSVLPSPSPPATPSKADEPIKENEILVTQCRLDVIALTWTSFRDGIWEVVSRLWSRPTPSNNSEGVPFAPGEPMVGLSLPERLLGGISPLNDLGSLFSHSPGAWSTLIADQEDISRIHRKLDGDFPALLVKEPAEADENRRWQLLRTHLARHARLICWIAESATS